MAHLESIQSLEGLPAELGLKLCNTSFVLDSVKHGICVPMFLSSFPLELGPRNSFLCIRSDACLPVLARCLTESRIPYKFLVCLDLRGTLAQDADMLELTTLVNLEVLDLSLTRVSDTGMGHLLRPIRYHLKSRETDSLPKENSNSIGLWKLRKLNLEGTLVTSASLPLLRLLPNLTDLILTRSSVTKEKLRQSSLLTDGQWKLSDSMDKSHDLEDQRRSGTLRGTALSSMVRMYIQECREGTISQSLTEFNGLFYWFYSLFGTPEAHGNDLNGPLLPLSHTRQLQMHDRLQFKPILVLTRDPVLSRSPSPQKKRIKTSEKTCLPSRIKLKPVTDSSLSSFLPLESWSLPDKMENTSKSFMNQMLKR